MYKKPLLSGTFSVIFDTLHGDKHLLYYAVKKYYFLGLLCSGIWFFKTYGLKYRLQTWCASQTVCVKLFPFCKRLSVSYTRGPYILTLYQIIKDIHTILMYSHLPYWADYGTLLGLVRHQGIIPWDDDGDLTMPATYRDEFFKKAAPFLTKLGYSVRSHGKGMITITAGKHMICLHDHELPPACDIFFADDQKDAYCVPLGACSDAKPILKSDLFPLTLYSFGSFQILGPKNPKPYLFNYFGKNCLHVARTGPIHQFDASYHNAQRYRGKFGLDQKAYRPAQPLGPLKDNRPDE